MRSSRKVFGEAAHVFAMSPRLPSDRGPTMGHAAGSGRVGVQGIGEILRNFNDRFKTTAARSLLEESARRFACSAAGDAASRRMRNGTLREPSRTSLP